MNIGLLILDVALVAALVAVVVLFLRRQREQEQAWTDERRELLTRIQRPEIVPIKRPPADSQAPSARRTAGLAQVGRVADPLDDGDQGDGRED